LVTKNSLPDFKSICAFRIAVIPITNTKITIAGPIDPIMLTVFLRPKRQVRRTHPDMRALPIRVLMLKYSLKYEPAPAIIRDAIPNRKTKENIDKIFPKMFPQECLNTSFKFFNLYFRESAAIIESKTIN